MGDHQLNHKTSAVKEQSIYTKRLFRFVIIGLALFLIKEVMQALGPTRQLTFPEGDPITLPVAVWWVDMWARLWEVWLVLLALIVLYYVEGYFVASVFKWKQRREQKRSQRP